MSTTVHPSAFVSPKAELADGVVIGPCALIDDHVVIGEGTRIDAFASVKQFTRIGKNNHIFSYAMVGEVPQDLKFHGEDSCLEIGDGNNIREFATLHRGTEGGGNLTRIGNNCLLMAYTHIAHDCILGSNIVMSNNASLAGHVTVDDYAIIGGLSGVHQFCHIGTHAFVGATTGIAKDLPPYLMAVGERAGLTGPNLVGLRRMKLGTEVLAAIKSAYRTIWLSGIPRQEALAMVEQQFAHVPQVLEIVSFIRTSQRGVMNPKSSTGEELEG